MNNSEINKSVEILKTLAKLVDDEIDTGNNKSFAYFNETGNMIDNDLVPVIEKIQYENKYTIVEKLKDTLMDMALYLYFPEIVNTTVVGIYNIYSYDKSADEFFNKVFEKRFNTNMLDRLKELLSKNKNSHVLSDIVPTILFGSQEQFPIKILNLPEKLIDCTNKDYIDFLKYSNENDLYLESFSYVISMSSSFIPQALSYITIPSDIDTDSKYFYPISNSIDILIIKGSMCTVEILKKFPNLSRLVVTDTISKSAKLYCEENKIEICSEYDDLDGAYKDINKKYTDVCGKDNFCYKYYFENLLLEISRYIATRENDIKDRIKLVNDNIVYMPDNIKNEANRFKAQYNYDIDDINSIIGTVKMN